MTTASWLYLVAGGITALAMVMSAMIYAIAVVLAAWIGGRSRN